MEAPVHILVVEDDATIADGLVAALEHERFLTTHVDNGEAALDVVKQDPPDLILCDIMLPGMDGIAVMRAIKDKHHDIPIILLTARSEEIDRVMGLELGADDYITKPFSVREVVARIKARLRGASGERKIPDNYAFGNVKVDLRRRILWRAGEEMHLTTHEAGALAYLIAHRGRDVSRDELLEKVWNYNVALTTRTVDNQILKLRKKIEPIPAQPQHILTVHGTGYRFEP